MNQQSIIKSRSRARYALALAPTMALAACTMQPPDSEPMVVQAAAQRPELPIPSRHQSSRHREHSWMRPEAKRLTLLYATDSTQGHVFVYTYPSGKLEGELTDVLGPTGDCIDKTGNIWIPSGSSYQILKFAHGGTSPIAILQDNSGPPYNCSIDPTSRNLAVVNEFSVVIYRHARGKPTEYMDTALAYYYFGGYDDQGNLFVDGLNTAGTFQFAELPKGGTSFTNFSLSAGVPGDVSWDGKHITFGDQLYGTISEVAVYGSTAKVVGQTTLTGAKDPVFQYTFWDLRAGAVARRVVGTDFDNPSGSVAIWSYPAGAMPRKLFSGSFYPTGIAISPPK